MTSRLPPIHPIRVALPSQCSAPQCAAQILQSRSLNVLLSPSHFVPSFVPHPPTQPSLPSFLPPSPSHRLIREFLVPSSGN